MNNYFIPINKYLFNIMKLYYYIIFLLFVSCSGQREIKEYGPQLVIDSSFISNNSIEWGNIDSSQNSGINDSVVGESELIINDMTGIQNEENETFSDTFIYGYFKILLNSTLTENGWNYTLTCQNHGIVSDTIFIQNMELTYHLLYDDFVGDQNQDLIFYTLSGSGSIPYFVMFRNDNWKFSEFYHGDEMFFSDTSGLISRFKSITIKNRKLRCSEFLYSKDGMDAMCCPSGGVRRRNFSYNENDQKFLLLN